MSRISKCITYPSASHIRVYGFQVSHISECVVSKCLTYPSAGHPSVRVYSISKCLTHSSVSHNHAYSVSHISECLFIQCLMPSKCLTHSGVSHNHTYSFNVSCPPCAYAFSIPFPKCLTYPCAHSVSHVSKHLTFEHIMLVHSVSHISKCLFIQCIVSPCVSHIRMYGFQVSHIIMLIHPVSCLQVPIHSVPHISKCLMSYMCLPSKCPMPSKCLFIQCFTYPIVCSFGA